MYTDNVIKYIKSGLGITPEPKQFRMLASGPIILALICLVPGVVLKNYWLLISIMMVAISFISIIAVFVLSARTLTVKNRLFLQAIVYLVWVLQISLLELMFFTMTYGFNTYLFLLYTPPVLIPFFLGIQFAKKLKKNTPLNSKKIVYSKVGSIGIISGLMGMHIAAIFRNVDQNAGLIIALVCFSFINSVLSVGLLSIQRLYYMFKLEKCGVMLTD